jgi:hypothetical protein
MNKMNRNTNISKTMHCIVIVKTIILLGQDIYIFLLENEESNLKVNLNYMIRTLFFHTDMKKFLFIFLNKLVMNIILLIVSIVLCDINENQIKFKMTCRKLKNESNKSNNGHCKIESVNRVKDLNFYVYLIRQKLKNKIFFKSINRLLGNKNKFSKIQYVFTLISTLTLRLIWDPGISIFDLLKTIYLCRNVCMVKYHTNKIIYYKSV